MGKESQKEHKRVGRGSRALEPVVTFLILGWGIELLLPRRFLDFFRVWLRRIARYQVW